MKKAIRTIDRAIKALYLLESAPKAEDFLLRQPVQGAKIGNQSLHGALYVSGDHKDVALGIYLHQDVQTGLKDFSRWDKGHWTSEQLHAFTVAAEEVSHFHYLLYHASYERQISQLELELQGEIDKFLLAWFANPQRDFDELFEKLFFHFRFNESLSEEQRHRYEAANKLARRFVRRHGRELLLDPKKTDSALRLLRRFYRLSISEKISLAAA